MMLQLSHTKSSLLPNTDYKSTLYGVWNSILTRQFPISDGDVTRPQDVHSGQAGGQGFSDLHTYQYQLPTTRKKKFLITQCKRTGLESWASIWRQAVDLLDRYIGSTRTRASARYYPAYGIVAIGKYMRVYKYDDRNGITDWAPPGLPSGKYWHLKDHAEQVQTILDHIRDYHWVPLRRPESCFWDSSIQVTLRSFRRLLCSFWHLQFGTGGILAKLCTMDLPIQVYSNE